MPIAYFSAPSLQVDDVWEDFIVLRIELGALTPVGIPPQWQVALGESESSEGDICKLFRVMAKSSSYTISGLPPHSLLSIRCRGCDEKTGRFGAWASLEQPLLPVVNLVQQEVHLHTLHIRWEFPRWVAPRSDIISSFEVRVRPESHPAQDEGGVYTAECKDKDANVGCGYFATELPPSPLDNQIVFVQMRPYSRRLDRWGEWSLTCRCFALCDVKLLIDMVSADAVTLKWGRYECGALSWPNTCVALDDLALTDFHVDVWRATLLSESDGSKPTCSLMSSTSPIKQQKPRLAAHVEAVQLHVTQPNITAVRGLEAETVYNMRVSYRNKCAGPAVCNFFRFCTVSVPELLQVPRVGTRFCELAWHLPTTPGKGVWAPYLDDDVPGESGVASQDTRPGAVHSASLQHYHVVDDVSAVPVAYRICLDSRQETDKLVVDVLHEDTELQHTRVNNLIPGTRYVVTMRCGGASKADVAANLALERAEWSAWTQSIVVTTLNELKVHIEQRGAHFVEIGWSCPAVLPVAVIESALQTDSKCPQTDTPSPQRHPAIRDLASQLVETSCLVVEIAAEQQQDVLSPQAETNWGEAQAESSRLRRFRYEGPGVVRFDNLEASTKYVVSFDAQNTEGGWSGRRHLVAETLPVEALAIQAVDRPHIDEQFHLEQQELPRVGGIEGGKIRYDVNIAGKREETLRLHATANSARIGNLALLTSVLSLGHDHAVLSWQALAVVIKGGEAQVVARGDDAVETAADIFNRSTALLEYRAKVQWGPLAQDSLSPSAIEPSKQSVDVYFRCCTRRTAISWLELGITIHRRALVL